MFTSGSPRVRCPLSLSGCEPEAIHPLRPGPCLSIRLNTPDLIHSIYCGTFDILFSNVSFI